MRRAVWCILLVSLSGCSFGPRALERSHGKYNEATKLVAEEQLLLNLVRARYNESPERLDVTSIAAQYELDLSAEARPFFGTESTSSQIQSFSRILPFAGSRVSNRPTLTFEPLDDPDTIRGLFTPSTLDGIIFLSETSFPIATVFRLWVEYMNRLPNGVSASGPPRDVAPEFRAFQRAAELLQILKDRGDLRFVCEEKLTEIGSPLPESSITPAAQVEAAKNEHEFKQRPDKTWILVKRDRQLDLVINPAALGSPEYEELCHLLHLRPGVLRYPVSVGGPDEVFAHSSPPEPTTRLQLYPRSTIQASFYMAHGVQVPTEHYACGLVQPAYNPDGTPVDWSEVTANLFTVHHSKHCRPKRAYVAVKYRGYWFYIDDRDVDSKITFSLLLTMTRVNLLGVRKAGPILTLPVGR